MPEDRIGILSHNKAAFWLRGALLLAQVGAQLANRLVLLVADALGGQTEFVGHVLNRPAFKAKLQNALLASREQLGGGQPNCLTLLGQIADVLVAPVGYGFDGTRVLPRPL